ncbi:flap endonuclease 1 (FEN1) [Vairimorpha necatrix]|uniref:Flap endonuclease 1 n=1 Tax=Vairimorpha necatrix TaxID=6039 RepID=A0AAX4JFN5_9MICR
MGIKQLSAVLKENCKKGIKEKPVASYTFKKIAIDISNFIYQFLIAVRSSGNPLGYGDIPTSHLIGMFYRTLRIVESGIIPIFIFDGKPPELKIYELKKRKEKREKADEELKIAEELENKIEIEKQTKRKIKVTDEHVKDCKKLLDLLKIPYLTAPSEAEAFCAYLCKQKIVHAVATEDMDTLPFGGLKLLRNFSAGVTKNQKIIEYNLEELLKDLDMNLDEFIDLCILLGCDYTESCKGIGPKKSLIFIKKYKNIENIFKNEKIEKNELFNFEKAREIFKELSSIEVDIDEREMNIKWDEIDMKEIKKYLVEEKGFEEKRVENGVNMMMKCRNKAKQSSLDAFIKKKQ